MTKATHNGTCQRCGNKQAIKNGVLVNHGYTVDNGWFQGICGGTNRKPLEVDTSYAKETVKFCRSESKKLAAITDADITRVGARVRSEYKYGVYETKMMTLEEYTEFRGDNLSITKLKDVVRYEVSKCHRHSRNLAAHAKDITGLMKTTFGQPLESREEIKPLRERFVFKSYKEADAKAQELKENGFKTRVTRDRYNGNVTLTATKVA